MARVRVAVIDDYQKIALKSADWASLDADVEVFHDPWRSEDHLVEDLADFEVISLLRERTPFPASVLARLPKLKLLSMTGRRTSTLDLEACTRRGIVVTYTNSPPSNAAAELAVGLMIACTRAIPAADIATRAGRFQSGVPVGIALAGRRLGVVGLGHLGSCVAKVGLALGMDVVAWSTNLTDAAAAVQGVKRVEKEELFRTSDVVSLHLVLSDRTKHIVAREEIALLKDGAIFINTARALLVDQAALLDRLRSGTLIAGLDVYDVEPLPSHSPLSNLPNVVLAPHLGYVVSEVLTCFFAESRNNIAAFLAGRPVNVINTAVLCKR